MVCLYKESEIRSHKVFGVCALFLCFAIFSFGCTSLQDYKPQSEEEERIKETVVNFIKGADEGDVKKVSSVLSEKATCMVGNERKRLSKAEYLQFLQETGPRQNPFNLGTPEIKVSGSEAEVKVFVTHVDWRVQMVFKLNKEKGKWSIISWEY
ncbi:MAG: nuclear transport factor 2 family protein [Deltaproteobacteria bacterium]|nr:nuclear transport factor 2 family protein [Deltaproteobacteria bacterium]